MTGTVMGTAGWLAPELLRDDEVTRRRRHLVAGGGPGLRGHRATAGRRQPGRGRAAQGPRRRPRPAGPAARGWRAASGAAWTRTRPGGRRRPSCGPSSAPAASADGRDRPADRHRGRPGRGPADGGRRPTPAAEPDRPTPAWVPAGRTGGVLGAGVAARAPRPAAGGGHRHRRSPCSAAIGLKLWAEDAGHREAPPGRAGDGHRGGGAGGRSRRWPRSSGCCSRSSPWSAWWCCSSSSAATSAEPRVERPAGPGRDCH